MSLADAMKCTLAVAATLAVSPARAATVVQTAPFDIFQINAAAIPHETAGRELVFGKSGTRSVSFTGFDPRLGTLTGASLKIASSYTDTWSVLVEAAEGQIDFETIVGLTYGLQGRDSIRLGMLSSRYYCQICLTAEAEDGTILYSFSAPGLVDAAAASDLTVSFTIAQQASWDPLWAINGSWNRALGQSLAWAGTAELRYQYTPFPVGGGVPEPASWALTILGFGAIGGAMRRCHARTVAAA